MADEIKKIVRVDTSASVKSLRDLKKAADEAKEATKGLKTSSADYDDKVKKARITQDAFTKELRLQVKEATAAKGSYNELVNTLARLKEEWKNTGDAATRADLTKKISKVKSQLNEMDHSIGNWQRNVGNYWGSIKNGFMALTGWITAAIAIFRKFSATVKVIADFEQSVANLGSILGATGDELKGLEQSALQLGRTTEWTASQVVLLQTELAKLGFSTPAIQNMQASVLQFATATGADLPRAAAFAGAALRAFGLVSSDTEDLLNVMAKATTSSALDFNKLETSISIVAPIAKGFGLTARDTAALLGTLANAGFDASTAATSLRNILLEYSKDGGKVQQTIGGQVRNFDELVQSLHKMRDAGVGNAEARDLVGKRSASALVVLTEMVNETEDLRDRLEDVDGTLSDIQGTRLDTLHGETLLLKSAWEGFELSLSNSKGFLRDIVHLTARAVSGVTNLISSSSRVQGYQAPQQSALMKVYKEQGAEAAIAAGEAFLKTSQEFYDKHRNEGNSMGLLGLLFPVMGSTGKVTGGEMVEAAENALDYINGVIENDRAEQEAARRRARQVQLEEEEEATKEEIKQAEKRQEKVAEIWRNEVAAVSKELKKETDTFVSELAKQAKADDAATKKMQDNAAKKAAAYATGLNGRKLAGVGAEQTAAEVTAKATIDDEKTLAATLYTIRKEANEKRLALLKQFEQDALKAHDPEQAIKYQREAAELEVKIEQDAVTEKARLRRQDTKDAENNAKKQIAAAQSIAGIMGNVASAYEAYIQQRLEGGKISEEAAEQEFENVKAIQYAQTWINTLAGMVAVWAGEGTNVTKAIQSAAVFAQGVAATMQIANTTLGSVASASQAVTSAAVAAPVVINTMPQVQALTSASQEDVLNERAAAQRVYVVYSDIAEAGRKVQVTNSESRF